MTSPLSIFFLFEAITKLSGKILFTTITVLKKIPNCVLDKSNDTKNPLFRNFLCYHKYHNLERTQVEIISDPNY